MRFTKHESLQSLLKLKQQNILFTDFDTKKVNAIPSKTLPSGFSQGGGMKCTVECNLVGRLP